MNNVQYGDRAVELESPKLISYYESQNWHVYGNFL